MLQISNLKKEYSRNGNKFFAVDDFNMVVEEGTLVCIVGPSGCGKSTLFHMISGLMKPTSGEIILNGEIVSEKSKSELASFRNEKIGYILQGENLLGNLSVIDNVCFPAYLQGKKKEKETKAWELLEKVGIAEMGNSYPGYLSGGEARRVAIARALINEPVCILADEPTSNLDPDSSETVMQLLKKIAQEGKMVLVSTHDMESLKYADVIYYMKKGQITDSKKNENGKCWGESGK